MSKYTETKIAQQLRRPIQINIAITGKRLNITKFDFVSKNIPSIQKQINVRSAD